MVDPDWSRTIYDTTVLPIDLHISKAYVFGAIEYNAAHWTRVYSLDGEIVVARVYQEQPLTKNITITFEAGLELTIKEQKTIREWVRYEIGADETLSTLKKVQEKDILTKIALKNSAGFRLFANINPVEVAICALIKHHSDYSAYQDILRDFVKQYGLPVPWDEHLYLFPTDDIIAEMDVVDWQDLGLGLVAGYLGSLSERDLKNIRIYSYYPIYQRGIEGLKRIDGIGDYTARLIMIYAVRRYDKPIMDGYIQELLDHRYKLHQVLPLSEFDKWIKSKWPENPALVLHTHIQDFLPAYIRDYDLYDIYGDPPEVPPPEVFSTEIEEEEEEEYFDEEPEITYKLSDIKGIGPATEQSLVEHGFDTVESIANAEIDELVKIKGIGKVTAQKFISFARGLLYD